MSVPSRMSVRPFPRPLEPRVRIAYARAWEAVITTHSGQALEFIQEFSSRMPVLEALQLYFRVVAVPEPMQEPVRTRTLVELDLDCLPPRQSIPSLQGWQWLRPDLVIRNMRARREFVETTLSLARMVGSRAAEAVIATHVSHAIEFARMLEGWVTVDRALAHYVYVFSLPQSTGLAVVQRAQASLVGRELAHAYRNALRQPDWEAEAGEEWQVADP